MKRIALLLLASLSITCAPAETEKAEAEKPGGAKPNTTRIDDPNDTLGPLDIRQVNHGLHGGQLTFQVDMWEDWSMKDVKRNWFAIPINMLSDDPDSTQKHFGTNYDYVASVTAGPYRFRATMYDHDKPDPVFVGPVATKITGAKKLTISFPESYLEAPGSYEWNLGSLYSGRRVCKKRCKDWTTGGGFFDLGATQNR
jgi:hypothetical protein